MPLFQAHKPDFIFKIIFWKGNLKLRRKNIQLITKEMVMWQLTLPRKALIPPVQKRSRKSRKWMYGRAVPGWAGLKNKFPEKVTWSRWGYHYKHLSKGRSPYFCLCPWKRPWKKVASPSPCVLDKWSSNAWNKRKIPKHAVLSFSDYIHCDSCCYPSFSSTVLLGLLEDCRGMNERYFDGKVKGTSIIPWFLIR